MAKRKEQLVNDGVYHVFNKSISDFVICRDSSEFMRMLHAVCYYQNEKRQISFSKFCKKKNEISDYVDVENDNKLVEIIAYCLMPTHFHLFLKQLKDNGIAIFMSNVLNSYTRFFNIKHNRKGPLWEGKFKNVSVKGDEQLLHLTRYIHLNPVTAFLVDRPEEWKYSSYGEYIERIVNSVNICNVIMYDMTTEEYKKFTEDRISYQRELAKIKKVIIE